MKLSKEQWENRAKLSEVRRKNNIKEYDLATHRDWVDQKNMGISHFGAIPLDYKISNMLIDIFHGRGNVYKVCLTYIRKILRGNWTAITAFAQMLNGWNSWDDYNVVTWILAKPMSSLRGDHTLEFSERTNEVCDLLLSIQKIPKVNAFCTAF